MSNIPTAQEYLETKQYDWVEDINTTECMIEFARIHVEAALKEASKKAGVNLYTKGTYKGSKWIKLKDGDTYSPLENELKSKVDKKSILNSYPIDKIK